MKNDGYSLGCIEAYNAYMSNWWKISALDIHPKQINQSNY